ncbi:enoyl-CoA hydratase/isomerase family protein [Paraburkholderia phytofirmans]|uniref:enoyl-CoA hydratase/isomerase family protein n=1 Tax=Paraburkholderia phytofirmans TaxID=261302 RepID=UPI0038BDD201
MGVIVQYHGEVAEVTLDWPDVRNALGPGEGRELRLTLEKVTTNEDVGAIVLSSSGKAFCAGGNLPEIVRLAEGGPSAVRETIYGEFQGVFRALRESPVPVLTAVDGAAVGFGCDLALVGNVTFVGERGWLAQGWIKAGLIPATGGTHYVISRAGEQAMWRLLASERVDGPTAERWGLAISCTHARETALNMANTLAGLPRSPLKALKQLAAQRDPSVHLEAALAYQVGFITDPGFAARANALINR